MKVSKDLLLMKVSDRDQSVDIVRKTGCVLMNFYHETFSNQTNLITDILSMRVLIIQARSWTSRIRC